MTNGVFISYRRDDSGPWAGRLTSELREYFGPPNVYRDVDSNRAGQDFIAQIEEALEETLAVIAVIGPNWLTATGAEGSGLSEMVRQELERAVAAGTPIIPVLVGGATVPQPDALPPALSRLPQLQMVRLADDSWEYDFARLLETLDSHGVVARVNAAGQKTAEAPQGATDDTVYQRTVRATTRRAYEAVGATAQALAVSIVSENPPATTLTMKLKLRTVTAKVVDEGAGHATVRLEMQTIKTKWLGVTAVVTAPFYFAGAIGWAGLRLWEREWAKTFFNNVERVIEGRGIEPAILAQRNPVQQV